jgi:hypothetical protein
MPTLEHSRFGLMWSLGRGRFTQWTPVNIGHLVVLVRHDHHSHGLAGREKVQSVDVVAKDMADLVMIQLPLMHFVRAKACTRRQRVSSRGYGCKVPAETLQTQTDAS